MRAQRNFSPLTPALSPLRGAGVAMDVHREVTDLAALVFFRLDLLEQLERSERGMDVAQIKTACSRSLSPQWGEGWGEG